MKYMIMNQFGIDFTHNDADAIGCAIVLDLFARHELSCIKFDDEKKYMCEDIVSLQHHFNSIYASESMISTYVNYVKRIIESDETLTDEELTLFKLLSLGKDYNDYEVFAIPKYIIISDLPLSETNANALEEHREKYEIEVVYVDHHASNNMNQYYPWCHVQSEEDGIPKSAAYFLREILFNPIKESVTYHQFKSIWGFGYDDYIEDISRYDTWEWKNHPKEIATEYYTNAIISYKGVKDAYLLISDTVLNRKEISSLRDDPECNILINLFDEARERAIKNGLATTVYTTGDKLSYPQEYHDCNVALVVLPDVNYNDVMEAIYKQEDRKVDIVMGMFPKTKTISFRGNNPEIDLSKLAKEVYSGGGHKYAAGAKVNTTVFINALTIYYNLLDELQDIK